MALINQTGHYIKLYADGTYEIYTSFEARERYKNSTPSEIILQKYQTLIQELEKQEEFRYYNGAAFEAQYHPLVNEYHKYRYCLANYITTETYPIMEQYYSDVKDTIPEIIESGQTLDASETTADTYEYAKKHLRWGDTTDA